MGPSASIFTIILFFLYLWGLGYSITRWSKKEESGLDRFFINLMIGFATMPILFVILEIIQYPFHNGFLIDWRVLALLCIVIPVYDLIRDLRKKTFKVTLPKFAMTKRNIIHLTLISLVLLTFFMYHHGAFKYDWLEDSDPWKHATSASYIRYERTILHNPDARFPSYFDPYPATYDAILGILHQTSPSLNWTLKFFNALIVTLPVLFIFYLAQLIFHNSTKALFAAFAYAMIPATLSHFIWSHALVPGMLIAGLYAYEKYFDESSWLIPAVVAISSFMLTTPTGGVKIVLLLFVYWLGKTLAAKKILWKTLGVAIIGVLLSMSWWGFEFARYGGVEGAWDVGFSTSIDVVAEPPQDAAEVSFIQKAYHAFRSFFDPQTGSGSRPYTFADFFIATPDNLINNPIGIGIVLSILGILGISLCLWYCISWKYTYAWPLLLVFVVSFLGVNVQTFHLPIGLFAFRWWMILAVPAALLAAEGYSYLHERISKTSISPLFLLIAVVIGAFFTSGLVKYEVNTSYWMASQGFHDVTELEDYSWLYNLPRDSKILTPTRFNFRVIGYDKYSCEWCPEIQQYRATIRDRTPMEIATFMKTQGIPYFMVDATLLPPTGNMTGEEITSYLQSIGTSGHFMMTRAAQTYYVFEVI